MSTVDWTKPIQTRDGRKARLLGMLDNKIYTHAVAITDGAGEFVTICADNGTYSDTASRLDIVNIPPKPRQIDVWVNYFYDGLYPIGCYLTRAAADAAVRGGHRIGCRKVVITEGFDA